MDEKRGDQLSWQSIIRFWVVGGWTLIIAGGVLLALSTLVL